MEIYPEEEQKIEAYQETSNIDIEKLKNFKISINIIKHLGVKSTKLYKNNYLKKLTLFQRIFFNSARIMQMNLIIYQLMSKTT